METPDKHNPTNSTLHNATSRMGSWFKNSITARMFMVGFLTLILLIPLMFVEGLINERKYRQSDVINEINGKWGNNVLVYGPILKLPYKTYSETTIYNEKTKSYSTETKTHINYAFISVSYTHLTLPTKA